MPIETDEEFLKLVQAKAAAAAQAAEQMKSPFATARTAALGAIPPPPPADMAPATGGPMVAPQTVSQPQPQPGMPLDQLRQLVELNKPAPPPLVQSKPGMDDETAHALERDAAAESARGWERAGRELIAGFTRTQAQPTMLQPGDEVAKLLAQRAAAKAAALKAAGQDLEAKKVDLATTTANNTARNIDSEIAAREAQRKQAEKTGGLAEKKEEREGTQAEKKAALDAEREQFEKYYKTKQLELEGRKVDIEKEKADQKQNKEGLGIPFHGGDLVPRTHAMRDADVSKAREIAGLSSATLAGMDDIEQAIKNYVAHPSPQTKNNIASKVRVVSSGMNAAIGGGAMSEAEARAISEALGADVLSPTGFAAVAASMLGENPEQAGATLLSRLRSARSAMENSALTRLKAYNYDFAPAAPAQARGAQPTTGAQSPATGSVKMKFPDGSVRAVPADKVKQAQGMGGQEV